MRHSLKKLAACVLVLMMMSFILLPVVWGDPTYSSTCAACGHVNTFTEEQVNNEVLYCSNCGALTMVSREGTTETDEGKWEYIGMDIKHIPPDWGSSGDPAEGTLSHSVDFKEGYATISTECLVGGRFYAPGDTATGRVTWSSPPKRSLKPGEKVSIDLKAELLRHDRYEFEAICFGLVESIYTSGSFESKFYLSGTGPVHVYHTDSKATVVATNNTGMDTANTVYINAPDQGTAGDRLTYRVLVHGTGVNYETVQCDYMYAWTGTVGAAAPSGPGDGLDPSSMIPQIIDSIASETAGDMQPVAVKTAVVIGALSTLAAAAAAASAGSAGSVPERELTRKEEEEALNKKGDYRMVVNKTFGNVIESGRADQVLYARMEQHQPDGSWLHIPAMDGQITIFPVTGVEGLRLDPPPAASAGRGKGQTVRLENEAPPYEAVVAFKFQGPDTYFQNNMTFKLGGVPKISIPKQFCLLGTSTVMQEVAYTITGLSDKPEVTLESTSDLFDLQIGKNKQGKDVILARATEKAGRMKFQRFVHRYPCEIIAKTDKITLKEKFQVHLCYEGIGTTYEGLKNNETPDEIILQCFTDNEKDKREEKAYRLPLAVMRWNSTEKRLEPDVEATGKLKLTVTANTRSKNLKVADAVKAVEDAAVVAEIEVGPSPVKMELEKKPAVYRIYPSRNAIAGAPEIEILLSVADEGGEFESLSLAGKLKPQADYKAMITWFIEYGQGTFVGKYLKIGDVAVYHGALDFIEDRIYSESAMPYTPKTVQNHYEDGKYDLSRPNYVYLQDASMPHQIGDFYEIQSLHHELCHAIEHQHGDTGAGGGKDERHSYFIQHLTDVVKTLADMEKGSLEVGVALRGAVQSYYNVFNDEHNADPQTFGWFGVNYLTQHQMFERYANFDMYGESTLSDARKHEIAMAFREGYYPGNLQGKASVGAKFRETSGLFKGSVWSFKVTTNFLGLIMGVSIEHPDFKFTERKKAQWVPGTLKIAAIFDVESIMTGKSDTLRVELDGGSFDPSNCHYPKIDRFTVTWDATDKISDSILGQTKLITEAVKG